MGPLCRRALLVPVVVLIQVQVRGHAIMYLPKPRSNVIFGPPGPSEFVFSGTKIRTPSSVYLQPASHRPAPHLPPLATAGFEMARVYSNQGCGGTTNKDPGVEIPTVVYTPGATIDVQWKLTIPHPDDVVTSGIRAAAGSKQNGSVTKLLCSHAACHPQAATQVCHRRRGCRRDGSSLPTQ